MLKQNKFWECSTDNSTSSHNHPWLDHILSMPPLFGTPTRARISRCLKVSKNLAAKCAQKRWDTGYDQLLQLLDLPTLARRRLYLDLSTMYKIVHGLVYFPPNIFVNRIGRTPNTTRPFLYSCPYACTYKLLSVFVCTAHGICMECVTLTCCCC